MSYPEIVYFRVDQISLFYEKLYIRWHMNSCIANISNYDFSL